MRITIKTVWSVTFFVSDLRRAAEFYESVLGLEKKYEYSSYVGFECGGVEIGLIPKPSEERRVDVRPQPIVGLLVDDVEKSCGELKRKGVKFVEELHQETWGGRQAAFTDLDGNVLEVVQINWPKYFEVSSKGAGK